MRRLIINIRDDDVNDTEATQMVRHVTTMGHLSQTAGTDHYCALTTFSDDIAVSCRPTRTGNMRFDVWRIRKSEGRA